MSYVQPHMLASLKDHQLEKLIDTKAVCHLHRDAEMSFTAFRMMKPKEWSHAVDILFGFGRIVLTGDLMIAGQYGTISCAGYGLPWFSGHLDPPYLAENFNVPQKWDQEKAVRDLAYLITDEYGFPAKKQSELADVLADLKRDYIDQHGMVERIRDIDQNILIDGFPGWGIDEVAVGWLAAVQQKFRDLYAATKAAAA